MFEPFVGGAEISLKRLAQGLSETGKIQPLIITSRINEKGDLIAGKDVIRRKVVRVGFYRSVNPIVRGSIRQVWSVAEDLT